MNTVKIFELVDGIGTNLSFHHCQKILNLSKKFEHSKNIFELTNEICINYSFLTGYRTKRKQLEVKSSDRQDVGPCLTLLSLVNAALIRQHLAIGKLNISCSLHCFPNMKNILIF